MELVEDEMSERDFLKRLQRVAGRRFQEGDVACPEAASQVTFKQALNAYDELGYVVRVRRGRDSLIQRRGHETGEEDPLPELADQLRAFLDA